PRSTLFPSTTLFRSALRSRVPRDRDAHPDEAHPRGGPGLSRAVAAACGRVLRAPPIAPDLQTAADGVRIRPLLPDRALLPGRGPALRPPARVHADRPGGLV